MKRRTVNKLFAGAMALTVAMTPFAQPITAFAAEGEVKGTYTGEDPVGTISVTVDCKNLEYTYNLASSTWTVNSKKFRVKDESENTAWIDGYDTATMKITYTPEEELKEYAVGTLSVGGDVLAAEKLVSDHASESGVEYTLTIANNSENKKAANEAIKAKLETKDTLGKIGTISVNYKDNRNN